MAKPDFAFRTAAHTAYATGEPGRYRLEPGGGTIVLTLERQEIPLALISPELERAAMAWVIARGGRELNLNGARRPIRPEQLDRPASATVRRLITIAPSNAEIVGALGATGLLVGAESSSDYPPEVLSLPRLGPDLNVDMEALAALEPDLVLASLTVPGMERNVAALERLGLPYLVHAPQNLAEIRADVERAGTAIGYGEEARRVVENLQRRVDELRAAREGREPVPVYLEWWPNPMFSPGAKCWTNELIELAGGVNVFRHLPVQSGEVAAADLVAADPEVIFLSWCGVPFDKLDPRRVLRRKGLESLRAVRGRRIYPVDESLLGRPGPRVVDGAEAMARAIRGA